MPRGRRSGNGPDPIANCISKAPAANNLKELDRDGIPLGTDDVCVTGVSGSGQEHSLITETLLLPRAGAAHLGQPRTLSRAQVHRRIRGTPNALDKVIEIRPVDPIGRTPRSNPATYTAAFTPIRELFALTVPEARARGYKPGRFSASTSRAGAARPARAAGPQQDRDAVSARRLRAPARSATGARYNREALEIRYKRQEHRTRCWNMTVEQDAHDVLRQHPRQVERRSWATLVDVGLGYIRLGQPATTLSGGEAQRVKLSSRTGQARHRSHALHPRRAHHRPAFRTTYAQRLIAVLQQAASTPATPSSSSSTTWTSSRPPTGSSTWGRRAEKRAATYWRRGRPRMWRASSTLTRGATSPECFAATRPGCVKRAPPDLLGAGPRPFCHPPLLRGAVRAGASALTGSVPPSWLQRSPQRWVTKRA